MIPGDMTADVCLMTCHVRLPCISSGMHDAQKARIWRSLVSCHEVLHSNNLQVRLACRIHTWCKALRQLPSPLQHSSPRRSREAAPHLGGCIRGNVTMQHNISRHQPGFLLQAAQPPAGDAAHRHGPGGVSAGRWLRAVPRVPRPVREAPAAGGPVLLGSPAAGERDLRTPAPPRIYPDIRNGWLQTLQPRWFSSQSRACVAG